MPKKDARPPAQVLDSIAEKAAEVREEANGLGECIDTFVTYLSKTQGRVETYAYGSHPDGPGDHQHSQSLALHFTREGKGWTLEYGTYIDGYNDDPENPVTYKPLSEAPLKYKIAAVKMFPKLLEAMERKQERLVEEIQEAKADFNTFMLALPSNPKEGK
jgi:hypothetical protein